MTKLPKKKTSRGESPSPAPDHPMQFRLPRGKECDQWWGANRSWWNERILQTPRNNWTPQIRSRVVRQPGAKKAVRFILWESAAEFFHKLDETTAREMEELRAKHAANPVPHAEAA